MSVFRCSRINAAGAGELDSAALRGSRAYEATPCYQIAPPAPSYEYAPRRPPPRSCRRRGASAYSFEFGARYWYSTGKLAKDLYDDPRFSNVLELAPDL